MGNPVERGRARAGWDRGLREGTSAEVRGTGAAPQ